MILGIPRLPILPTIVVAAAIATMIALGVWQLGRMDEKAVLMERYAGANENAAPLASLPEDPAQFLYRSAPFNCAKVLSINSVSGRNAKDQAGYKHIATCQSGAGAGAETNPRIAEVVFGWSKQPRPPEWQGGAITGKISPNGELGWRIVSAAPQAGLQANAMPDPANMPNNHLAYAGQWFFFAFTALVIYILALRKISG